MQRLIIRAKMPNLNDVIAASKRHWSYYSKEKKRWTEVAAQEAQAQGLYKMRLPVWVRTTYYMKTRRGDPDNVRVAIKYILDGLVQAGVLEDDSQRWIVGFQDLYDLDRDDPRIEVQLMPDPREA
jgi:Holliday junction resolvase RusA-like endonuclease